MSFPGRLNSCRNISGNQKAGYALVFWENNQLQLAKFGVETEIATQPLEWENIQAGFGWVFQGILRDRLVFGATSRIGGPVTVLEYANGDGSIVERHTFGDASSVIGECVQLSNGGLAGVCFCDTRPENRIRFDAFYRAPVAPFANYKSQWFTMRFDFASNASTYWPYTVTAAEGPDGLFWVFFARDSVGTIGLIRFRLELGYEGPNMSLVDLDAGWIKRYDGAIAPSGEMPELFSICDRKGGRILLAYQGWPHGYTECTGYPTFTSHYVITAASPDLRAVAVGTTEWQGSHLTASRAAVFPRQDGIYFMLDYLNPENCEQGWNLGLFDGAFRINRTLPRGKIVAHSEDGMIAFYDQTQGPVGTTELIKLRFRPHMSIRQNGQDISIHWDEARQGDALEGSTDGRTWATVQEAASSPAVLAASEPHKLFKIRSSP